MYHFTKRPNNIISLFEKNDSFHFDEDDFDEDDEDDTRGFYTPSHQTNVGHNNDNENKSEPTFKTIEEKTKFYKQKLLHVTKLKGDLDLRDCQITTLSSLKVVDGDVDLSGTLIQDLNDLMIVSGNFFLNHCTHLVSLSQLNTVMGNLYLLHDPALRTCDFLSYIAGNLYIKDTSLTSLPDFITIKGKIYLSGEMQKKLKLSEELKQKVVVVR